MQQSQAAGAFHRATSPNVLLLLSCLQYEYLWADGVKYKKPVRLSAPEYVDKLFDWIEDQVRCRRQQDRIRGGQYGSTCRS
jgi:MOB kinase activator 1